MSPFMDFTLGISNDIGYVTTNVMTESGLIKSVTNAREQWERSPQRRFRHSNACCTGTTRQRMCTTAMSTPGMTSGECLRRRTICSANCS